MPLKDHKKAVPESIFSILESKIEDFLPVQEEAIKKGLFERKSMIISSPTASGKTLIAELAVLNNFFSGKKSVYVAPMRALISEKFDDFKRDYPFVKSALSMGDLTEYDSSLEKYDVIFVSTEKLDSLLRFSKNYVMDIGCIVYDEIHVLGDPKRGPTLEFLVTLNKRINPGAQIIGLSATIINADKIAGWLGCELVESRFRPVKLLKKVYLDGELINGDRVEVPNTMDSPLDNVLSYLLSRRRQALVFSETKKLTVTHAGRAAQFVNMALTEEDKEKLYKVADEILHVLDSPTSQCETLAEMVRKGVAFHHSGLLNRQRRLIEENFKSGLLKFIFATPTLAMGVNLPANTVVISSIYRFNEYRREPLRALEIEQMTGRAGRPKYDREGTAIIMSKSEAEYDFIKDKYIDGDTEPIVSGFNNDSAVRRYVLDLLCTGLYPSKGAVKDFFDYLFASEQGLNLESMVEEAVDFFEDNDFVEESGGSLVATATGRLINSLYLDPYTGLLFMDFVRKTSGGKSRPFDVFHVVFCSNEFSSLRVGKGEFEKYEEESYSSRLSADQNLVDYEKYIASIKFAHILDDWVDEKSEKYIEDEYRILPGEFNAILETIKWLLHALKELSRLSGGKTTEMIRLEKRVRYGIREELIPFVSIPDIGRVRSRRIYDSGIKSVAELKEKKEETLRRMLGNRIGYRVYKYLHKEDRKQTLFGGAD